MDFQDGADGDQVLRVEIPDDVLALPDVIELIEEH
jgi:hypothetical protein